MAQYDGSILIDTEIHTKKAEKELKSLKSSITKTANEIASLRSKMDELRDVQIPTQEYKDISDQIQKAEAEFDKLLEKQKQMQREGKDSGVAWERLNYKMEEIGNTIRYAKGELKELVDTGKAFTLGTETEKYAEMSAQVQQLTQQMQSDTERQAELQSQIAKREEHLAELRENAVVGNQRIIETVERIKHLEQEIADLKAAGVTEGYSDYDVRVQELSELKQEVKDYGNGIEEVKSKCKRLGDIAKSAFEKASGSAKKTVGSVKSMVSMLKNAVSLINLFGKNTKSSNNVLQSGFKNILKYGLGIRSLFVLINKLRNAIKEGFSNLYNDINITGFKNQIDGLRASFLTLKNSFAAAFRPLVEVAIPYIQMATDAMIVFLNAVAQFTAAITGQKTYTKALRQTTAALEDQNKAQSKQLSGLDKLNNLTSKNGVGNADTGAGIMFEEVALPGKFADIAEWLKSMWENADFTELGAAISDKLKNALNSINWESIKESAEDLAKSIATFINGAIETKGFGYSIGNTLAQGINTGFEFLNSFVHTLNWVGVGSFIAEQLNGFFENIDWDLIYDTFVTGAEELGKLINSFIDNFNWDNVSDTISKIINIIVSTVYTFFSTVDWKELGQKLGEQLTKTIKKIDWEKVGRTIGSMIQSALDFAIGFIQNLDLKDVAQAIIDTIKGFFSEVDFEDFALVAGSLMAASLLKNIVVGTFASAATGLGSTIGSALTTYALPTILAAVAGWNLGELIGREIFGDEAYDNFSWKEFFGALNWEDFKGFMTELGKESFFTFTETVSGELKEIAETSSSVTNTIMQGFVESANTMENFAKEIGDVKEDVLTSISGIEDKWKSSKTNLKHIVSGLNKKIADSFVDSYDDILKRTENFIKDLKNKLNNVNNVFSSVGGFTSSFISGRASAATYSMRPEFAALQSAEFPGYATGQVIPTTMKKHLAWLGDNNRETEVVSPLSTMKQANKEAIIEVLSEFGLTGRNDRDSGNETFVFQVDGDTFFEIVRKKAQEHFNSTGYSAFPI